MSLRFVVASRTLHPGDVLEGRVEGAAGASVRLCYSVRARDQRTDATRTVATGGSDFRFPIPVDAPLSLKGQVLRLDWQLEAGDRRLPLTVTSGGGATPPDPMRPFQRWRRREALIDAATTSYLALAGAIVGGAAGGALGLTELGLGAGAIAGLGGMIWRAVPRGAPQGPLHPGDTVEVPAGGPWRLVYREEWVQQGRRVLNTGGHITTRRWESQEVLVAEEAGPGSVTIPADAPPTLLLPAHRLLWGVAQGGVWQPLVVVPRLRAADAR